MRDERSGGHQPGSDYVSGDGSAVYGGRHRAGVGRVCECGFRLYLWKRNLDIRTDWIMMVSVLTFTVVGAMFPVRSFPTMGSFFCVMTLLLGIKFIARRLRQPRRQCRGRFAKKRAVQSIICGMLIGFICGFVGAGGVADDAAILTSVLGCELKPQWNERVYHGVYGIYRIGFGISPSAVRLNGWC